MVEGARPLQPLANNFKIVDEAGFPTDYFILWAQERQIDISDSLTAEQVQQLIDDWAAARSINTTTPILGGGALDADLTIEHAPSGVTADTYGDSTHVPQITVDEFGHVTEVVEVPVSGGGGGGGEPVFVPAICIYEGPVVITATGSFTGNPNNSAGPAYFDDFYWNTTAAAQRLDFDFGAPTVLQGFMILQDTPTGQGDWQVAVSSDGLAYTDIGAPFTWGTGKVSRVTFANGTGYQYYRVYKTSGSSNSHPFQRLFLFAA